MRTSSKQHNIHIHILLLLCFYCSTDAEAKHNTSVSCLPDQASSLLQLKHSFVDVDRNLASWQPGRDCCYWKGVTCDMASGSVLSLDLAGFNLKSSHLDPALFNLTSLRNLSLAFNYFNGANLPSYGFERLTNIVHLNLSSTVFFGQIPIGIARLKNLLTLDFSGNSDMYLQEPNFQTFVANLSNMRELLLDGVDISSAGSTWSFVLSSSAPQLQILNLNGCGLSGPIHPSFSRLHSLSVIQLADNFDLTGKVPEYFAEFSSLSILDVSSNSFEGDFPTKIFQIKSLRFLDFSENRLSVCLPDFMVGNNLEVLNLAESNLSCDTPSSFTNLMSLKTLGLCTTGISKWSSSISNLSLLKELQLYACGSVKPVLTWITSLKQLTSLRLDGYDLSRSAPFWIGNLTSLSSLEISRCDFSTPIPYQIGTLANMTSLVLIDCNNNGQSIPSWIGNLTKLIELKLFNSSFSGSIPSTIGDLTQLEVFNGAYNSLSGKIPKSLFVLPALQTLTLSSNQISGLEDTSVLLSSSLSTISLDINHLTGPIPESFLHLKHLEYLDLSSNTFSGIIELSSFWKLKNLTTLILSNNMLLAVEEGSVNTLSYLPKIKHLGLASCNLKKLPSALRYLDSLWHLDLSSNKIDGIIPSWMWENPLVSLNLSRNMFTSLEKSNYLVHMPYLNLLDLSFNRLQGTIPIPLTKTSRLVLDYSNNNFSSIVPNFGNYITNMVYLDLSRNKLNGYIPSSICSAIQLDNMDLSYNNFSGTIPSCIIESKKLNVLKLRANQLQGTLPKNITEGCKLKTLDFGGNQLEGKLPKSLLNCQDLQLLDVGNNRLTGSFPSWLGVLPHLRVLVIKFNQFNGIIKYDPSINTHFTSLQILCLASNNFSGNLPNGWFNEMKAMMATDNNMGQVLGHYTDPTRFYRDTITITFKGSDIIFTKILTTFKAIDLANNTFDGPIPESLGNLVSLHGLNMSFNNFTGQIPSQFTNLSGLESLDLSWNQLSGEIPWDLTSLTSLEWLNISYNKLTGKIPHGNQFSTFSNSSFEGNAGLCGIPLSELCDNQGSIDPSARAQSESNGFWQDKLGIIILFAFVGLGFGVGFTLSFFLRSSCNIEWRVRKDP